MKLSYRSEIDGLRTIAVLSVILYHAQFVVFGHDFFKGGFVGVDIFFVISGYLISRILLGELFEKGKISFLQFYERRARRILPILFTVFLISFPLAYKYSYLLPNQFIEYAHSILSATFFGSNIFFYFTNTQYGAEDSLLQPFLHTWSLGVEEQFYILFPIVLLLAYKFAKNHLVTIIVVLILISLTYADWQSTKNIQLNFFMLTSRLWELGIGSLLAFYELKYGKVKHGLLNHTMPLLGLAMIVYSIIFFNNQTPHPSFITLLPTIGTALIILYSINKTDMVGKVLSWKPIVGIGLISYSMYLWHYPLFAFARIADTIGLHNDEKYLLILLTIGLSIVSYFVIEKPFRNKQLLNIKRFNVAMLICLVTLLIISSYVLKISLDKKNRLINFQKENLSCLGENNFSNKKNKKILVIGNSHSYDFYCSMILNDKRLNNKYEFRILKANPKTGDRFFTKSKSNSTKEIKLIKSIFLEDVYLKSNTVILAANLSKARLEKYDELFKRLKNDQKKVIVLSSKVTFEIKSKYESPTERILMREPNLKASQVNKKVRKIMIKKEDLNRRLEQKALKYSFYFYDFQNLICNEKECDVISINYNDYYRNRGHWSLVGAKYYGGKILDNGFLELIDSLN
jgi:peptidoglycan/LPS O-acetylase OafA/YrhL